MVLEQAGSPNILYFVYKTALYFYHSVFLKKKICKSTTCTIHYGSEKSKISNLTVVGVFFKTIGLLQISVPGACWRNFTPHNFVWNG